MGYREAAFYFFTGTGNSYRVAIWIAELAQGEGAAVTVRPIGLAHPVKEIGEGATALLGLILPTHCFTAPWTVLRFALRLPRSPKTHAVAVATRAGVKIGRVFTPGIEGTAAYLVALILALKGYCVRGVIAVDMPANVLQLHPSLSRTAVAAIITRAKAKVTGFISAVLSGKRRFASRITLLLGLWLFPVSVVYLLIGRFFMAKLYFASDRCTGCGLCANYCPNHAIEMRGGERHHRPYWTFRCESCTRCIAYCPVQAVEVSQPLGVGAYLLAMALPTTSLLAWLAAQLSVLGLLTSIPLWVLETAYGVVALGLVYPLFHVLLKTARVNRFFTRASLTHYYRRYREPGTTLKDLK